MFVKILKEGAVIMKCENYDNILPLWILWWSLKEQAPVEGFHTCLFAPLRNLHPLMG